MFPLLETIKIQNGIAQNLFWHTQRMNVSYKELFGTECHFDLGDIIRLNFKTEFKPETAVGADSLPAAAPSISKARFLYGRDNYKIEFEQYTPKTVNSLKLVVCNDIDYHLKYSSRDYLNSLAMQRDGADDILIVKDGFVTDTSFSNIIFSDGTAWYTARKPLLRGTCRARLIKNNIIEERDIKPEDLSGFSYFMLINAMLDFDPERAKPLTIMS